MLMIWHAASRRGIVGGRADKSGPKILFPLPFAGVTRRDASKYSLPEEEEDSIMDGFQKER
jgi:hypothetical protein